VCRIESWVKGGVTADCQEDDDSIEGGDIDIAMVLPGEDKIQS